MPVSLDLVPNALEIRLGLPRPDWAAIWKWVDANVSEGDLNNACTQLATEWVDKLIDALPSGYSRTDSPQFMLLANTDPQTNEHLLDLCENSRRIILDTLNGVASAIGYGKHVVLAFGEIDTYYDYVADFYPDDGEFAPSGGMFLDHGYGHIVVCIAYTGYSDRTIAHEMSHALIRHLPLPLWLNEGVTQVIEDLVVGSSYFMVNPEMVRRHREYWNSDSIHSFWSGDSFYSPDDGQELSYHLSQILIRNLMSDYSKSISEFLNAANFVDAGNSALNDVYGISLGDRVSQFLGAGAWHPRADYFEIGT